ncbi:MAG: helix-turn-helix domain-containing protein [Streptosporangiales bacterium]|nr:helix-turn-helix domain-containing protein [Streptosporangiales bacterium]
MYEERPSAVAGAVLWRNVVQADAPVVPVAPDGCTDLIWVDGTLLVAGPDTRPNLARLPRGVVYIGLRFAPGTGPLVFGVPAHELRDRRIPLAEVWPAASGRRLTERIGEADAPGRALETAAGELLATAPPPDPLLRRVVACTRSGLPVASIADRVGLSERQLHRRCLPAFGYGAKTLTRILRMQAAVARARDGVPYATVAATGGYADQAHLSREVRALAGVPLGVLTR